MEGSVSIAPEGGGLPRLAFLMNIFHFDLKTLK
jgi:hypothetical protein